MGNSAVLKELYKDYFRIGVACEKINGPFTKHEIGNPDKEALMSKHFNSMTFGNELKPAYNMGCKSPEAAEEYLPFVINPIAKDMLDWAKANNMPVRGHVMVWHSQCPNEVFCKGYTPVTIPTDPETLKSRPMMRFFEKLDPSCFVSRDTLLKRLKTYIFSLVEYMYANDYGRTIYAWDVVNEAIEPADKKETGLRDSYWYKIIGEDFIYWAFRFARDAVTELSVKYAPAYGIDPSDEEAVKAIRPILFYNDYNEFQPEKKAFIIAMLKREGEDHGSILSEKLADGIGMQGHLSDNNDIDEYISALWDYSELVENVHITELDVKCTCSNINAEYYQAVFYKKFFEALIDARKKGAHLKAVTFWGLTDDNSWIRGANPLLFHGDLSEKKAFDALVYALDGTSLGDPQPVIYNLDDRNTDFEECMITPVPEGGRPGPGFEFKDPALEKLNFKAVGFSQIAVTDKVFRTGTRSLAMEHRFGAWMGIGWDVTDFIGQTVKVSAWVMSPAKAVTLNAGTDETQKSIASEASEGKWVQLETTYRIPANVHSMILRFGTEEDSPEKFSPIYVDSASLKLIGITESFEDETNIAAIRGVGHLPFCYVTDKEAHDGKGKSYCVTRQEKDATVKFNISQYVGRKIDITLFVKTTDKLIRVGLDGAEPVKYAEVNSVKDDWTKITASAAIPDDLLSAELYVETDGNADFYVDDIFVTLSE